MIERRSTPRIYESHPVLYVTDSYPERREASTLDLSLEGLRIETPFNLRTGESLEISIAIPHQPIKCEGKVIHVLKLRDEKAKVGVRFENLPKQDRFHLGRYISYAMKQQSKASKPNRGIIIGIAFGLLAWAAIIYGIIVLVLR
jgi:c-di-GMP-binding flagellar brake protein YcgR